MLVAVGAAVAGYAYYLWKTGPRERAPDAAAIMMATRIPDIEGRGFKVAPDAHGPRFDPDTGERRVTAEGLAAARAFLAKRFPRLTDAPLVASEVCQYENSSNGDFLIDRLPGHADVWLVGAGSGHGFKHGPAVGELAAQMVLGDRRPDPRFTLLNKTADARRAIY